MSEGHVLHHDFEAATFNPSPSEVKEYIPLSLAAKKLHDVTSDFSEYRSQQTAYADRLNSFYQNALSQSTQYYESLVNKTRTKALRHIEIKQKQIDELTKEISARDEKIEELRDSLAAMTMLHQEDQRSLQSHPAAKQLEEAVNQHAIEIERLTQSKQVIVDECQTLKNSLASLSQENWEVKAHLQLLDSEKQSLVDENLNLNREIYTLRATLVEQSEKMEVKEEDRQKMLSALEQKPHHHSTVEAHRPLPSSKEMDTSQLQSAIVTLNCEITLQSIISAIIERHQSSTPEIITNDNSIPTGYNPSSILEDCQRLAVSLASIRDNLKILNTKVQEATEVKNSAKNSIKIWVSEFKATNGRDPDKSDKIVVKDRYLAYKNITTKLEQYQDEVNNLEKEENQVEEAIANIKQLTAGNADLTSRIDRILSSGGRDNGIISDLNSISSPQESSVEPVPPEHAESQQVTRGNSIVTHTLSETETVTATMSKNVESLPDESKTIATEDILSVQSATPSTPLVPIVMTTSLTESTPIVNPEGAPDESSQTPAVIQSLPGAVDDNLNVAGVNSKIQPEAVLENSIQVSTENPSPPRALDAVAVRSEEDSKLFEKMEEEIYELKKELKTAQEERDKMNMEKDNISSRLEAIIKEKRSDVIKRQEEELNTLRIELSTLTESNTILQTEKKKNDMKLIEFRERFEQAEKELKLRSADDSANPNDHKSQLMAQIGKQREDIVMKSKAATAGWVRLQICSREYMYIHIYACIRSQY